MRGEKTLPGGLIRFVVLLAVLLALPYFLKGTIVSGDSMLPTLKSGDHLLIDKWSYRIGKPQRFDVAVFSYQYKPNTYYIKRIIGLPGETVRISAEGVIYVNGNALVEHYGNAAIEDGGLAANTVTLGEDEYFVLGDNRNSSVDSREPEVGNIRERDIVGKGWLCVLPLERFGVMDHAEETIRDESRAGSRRTGGAAAAS